MLSAGDGDGVLDEQASDARSPEMGFHEQAVEFTCPIDGAEQDMEADRHACALGDAHETVVDLRGRKLDRVGMFQ